MVEKLVKFIKKNDLMFEGSGSDLNSSCVIISGFADFISASEEDILKAVKKSEPFVDVDALEKEIDKTYRFAKKHLYGAYWKTPEARRMYQF